jgi:hypothetical protein
VSGVPLKNSKGTEDVAQEFLVLHLRGDIAMKQFLALAHLLALEHASRPFANLLFDWSDLLFWDFQPLARHEIQPWLEDTHFVERIAIVHHRRWNRQAAWLSALLRTRDCVVRSYGHKDYRRAMTWLCQEQPNEGSSGREIAIENGVLCGF